MTATQRESLVQRLLIAGFWLCLGGCSTFEVYDAYTARETGKRYVGFDAKDAHLSLAFVPDQRLGSIGVFGIPAIPVWARTSQARVIALDIELTLSKSARFSFRVPCLTTPSGDLCPQYASITATLQSADQNARDARGIRTYGYIENFRGRDSLTVSLPLKPESKSIEDGFIFEHYGYRGQPEWTFGVVRLTYVYACSSVCPATFSLVADNIVSVEGGLHAEGTYNFQKQRTNDYKALRPVQ